MPLPIRQGTITESVDSPQYDYGKNLTKTRIYVGSEAECLAYALRPGVLGTGADAGFVCDGSTVMPAGGTNYRVTIKYIAYGPADLPQDEYSVDPFEINPKLEKHPRYAGLTEENLETVKQAVDANSLSARTQAWNEIAGSFDINMPEMLEIVKKLLRGQDSYYLPGLKYVWSSHYPVDGVPALTLGGTIETPGGPCAPYLPPGATWLREADKLAWTGTVWKVTRVWVGAPTGHWDTDIYQPA